VADTDAQADSAFAPSYLAMMNRIGRERGWPPSGRPQYEALRSPRGALAVGSPEEVADWLADATRDAAASGGGPLAGGLLAEEKVDFVRELALLVVRSPSGQAGAWQIVETIQTDGICTQVLAPAPDLSPQLAASASGMDCSNTCKPSSTRPLITSAVPRRSSPSARR